MAATLCALYELAKQDPYPYRNLIPSLSSIIKQIIEQRLSKTYEYHHCPAPFIQVHPVSAHAPFLVVIDSFVEDSGITGRRRQTVNR